ncbi:MAG: alpha-mannosidase, partial [Clostridia bacterium]|nr:alpha-mannosidase [Clostridia bacterium]
DTLDNDPSFKSFHLDGQAIVIEDYLEVRPQMQEKIEKYIAEGRLVAGPWYILQDEYLIGGESNVRNMLIGKQVSAKYGQVSDIGYFPDAFGNIGHAPQILRGFGIDCVAFGRGVSPRKGDRLDTGEENYGKAVSEVRWRSPDGSEVIGAAYLNWYNNASEIPAENTAARLDAIRQNCERVATTPHLLCMNGCDHQPVQTDIGRILEKESETYPHTLIHSNFRAYFDAIKPYQDRFGIFVGELDGEYSNGWSTLANTASARIYLKQWNAVCENLLERQAEPMAVAAQLYTGKPVDRDYFRFIWKNLLQNHPHDSICGCSVDDVHTEMVTRFKKVHAAAGQILRSNAESVAAAIHTADLLGEKTITVWNPLGRKANEWTEVNVDFPKDSTLQAGDIAVYDGNRRIPAVIEDCGVQFEYILPEDTFRVPFYVRRFRAAFRAEDLPPVGYKTFTVRTDAADEIRSELKVSGRRMMNRYLTVIIQKDGSVRVTDKRSKSAYTTGIMLDSGDIGDEYIYRETEDHVRVSTEGKTARLEMIQCSPAVITYKVTHTMQVPADADRASGKRIGSAVLTIDNYFTLRAGADRLDVKTVIHNNAKNHRITMLTKNDIQTDMLLAEGQFDIVKRPITPWEGWTNPTKPGKMTTFFGLEDEKRGLLIAGRGLQEYEVLRDGENTMALTLHRGIDQLGDWGVFPTPDAQCLGELTVEYALIPYAVRNRCDAVDSAYSFAAAPFYSRSDDTHTGTIPAEGSIIPMEGRGYVVSAVKMCETRDSVICRVFQPYEKDTKLVIAAEDRYAEAWLVDL